MGKVFGTAGVRGIFNETFDFKISLKLCYSLSSFKKKGKIVIAQDGRLGSEVIKREIESGFIYAGWDILDLGVSITPLLAFSTRLFKGEFGIMITASHNPPEYVGIKIFDREGTELSTEKEKEVEQKLNAAVKADWKSLGSIRKIEANEKYIKEILEREKETSRQLKIVVDCANSPVAPIISRILSSLKHKFILVNSHLNGKFPGRLPEPIPENLSRTAKYVKNLKFDLGLAFDGDGDRIAIIDERGKCISLHSVLATFVKKRLELKKNGNKKVVISVDCSNAVKQVVEEMGGKIYMSRLGKISEVMKKYRAVVGVEPWKIIDADWGLWEDGVYASIKLIQWISESDLTTSEFFSQVPQYPHKRISLKIRGREEGERIIEKIRKKLKKDSINVVDIDGFRFELSEKAWVLVRPSGTEDKLRIYAEAENENELNKIIKKVFEAGGFLVRGT